MSITRRYNQLIAAWKRLTAEAVDPTRKHSAVPHDHAALKLGVGDDRFD